MDLNSPLFDRIRAKRAPQEEKRDATIRCDFPGCAAPGEHRAPMGRLREGQYFCFCLEHVRAYNNSYNYFNGMSDDDVARYAKEAVVGHRPTWSMGVKRGQPGFREEGGKGNEFAADPLSLYRGRYQRTKERAEAAPRYSPVTMRALAALNLSDSATAEKIKARYKELVKRLHPDANGGDRSCEEKLREILHAYKTLRAARLV